MSQLPREWVITASNGSGTDTVITIPGVPGVTHVIDSILARITSNTTQYGGAGSGKVYAPAFSITTSGGVPVIHYLIIPGNSVTTDEISLSGLGLVTPIGTAVTLTLTGSGDGRLIPAITAQGYDI